MAADTLYLVFCQNTSTHEDFTVPFASKINDHATILNIAAQNYPAPQFKVFTAYTIEELQKTLETYNRWGTITNKALAQTAKPAPTAIPKSTVKATVKKATPAHPAATATQQETATPKTTVSPKETSTPGDSSPLLNLLKEMQTARPAARTAGTSPHAPAPHKDVNVPVGAAAALRAEIAKKEAANPPPKSVLENFPFGVSATVKKTTAPAAPTPQAQPTQPSVQSPSRDMFGRLIEPKKAKAPLKARTQPRPVSQTQVVEEATSKADTTATAPAPSPSLATPATESVIARLKALRLQQTA